MLLLHEEMMLLAIHDRWGKYKSGRHNRFKKLINLAIIYELILQEMINMDDDEIRQKEGLYEEYNRMTNRQAGTLIAFDMSRFGDYAIDFTRDQIAKQNNQKGPKFWQLFLTKYNDIYQEIINNLLDKEFLKKKEKGRGIFKRTSLDGSGKPDEFELRMRLSLIASGKSIPDERTIILLSILKNTSIAREMFQNTAQNIFYVVRDWLESGYGSNNARRLMWTYFDISDTR